jgi:hypothetical protein
MTIYYWPDGCWCEESELLSMHHKSDDFTPLVLPDENHYEDWHIDMMVQELISA